jgi:non-lysosomal glucosylceramidase
MGAINGIRPDGQLDDTCMQSLEVWTGTTFAAAAAMLQQGLVKEAFDTAKGIIVSTYDRFGYMFQTPEAWDVKGQYRSAAYMR